MGSPVDDALNRQLVPLTRAAAEAADADLQAEFMRLNPELQRRVALGLLEIDALRRQVEQLREERDDLYENNWPWEWVIAGREKERRQAAEAEVQRLREERDAAQRMADHMVTLDGPNAWAIANAERHRAEAAEAEVQRLTEGLREIAEWDGRSAEIHGNRGVREYARALLAGSAGEHAEGEGGEA